MRDGANYNVLCLSPILTSADVRIDVTMTITGLAAAR